MDRDLVQQLIRLKLKDNRLPHGRAVALREIGRFAGNARPCDACDEGIGPYRKAVLVMVSAQWMSVFFHGECYEVWDAERLALSDEEWLTGLVDLFRRFLSNLSAGSGYCVDCLSQMYGEPVKAIGGYLSEVGIVGHHAECPNCHERKATFKANPSS